MTDKPLSDTRAERVKPELPGGFNDYDAAEMVARQRMVATVQASFERYGFTPLDTPSVEFADVLLGKSGETEKQVFRLASSADSESRPLALRYDLTVPLSRYVAAHGDLTFPFKRYQLGDVFRGERPQAGRYRQFKQFDADVVGTRSLIADAEIVAVMRETLLALGVERFTIRVNNRKILNGLLATLNFKKRAGVDSDALAKQLMRVLDKLDSIGLDGVLAELGRAPRDEWDRALGLDEAARDRVRRFLSLEGDNATLLTALRETVGDNAIGAEGVDELEELLAHIAALGVPEDVVRLDVSIARGLDYYTGTVLETALTDLPEIGSVMSGGRYDGLVGRFTSNPIPAVGASIGIDRLFTAMKQLDLVDTNATTVQALVMVLDPEELADYLRLLTHIRQGGWNADVYYGANRSFKAQMRYALRKGIRFLIIRGGDEREAGTAQVKDLRQRRQEPVPLDDLNDLLTTWWAN